MSAILKQKLIDIANGFTKYGLWKGGGSVGCSNMVDFDNVITTISGAKRIEYTAQENCYLYKQTIATGSNGNENISINGNKIGWTIYTSGTTIGGYALIPLKKDDTIIIENASDLSFTWQQITIYGVVKENNLHEYSTEEKVVGKWIDGKPIYEKVISGNMIASPPDWVNFYDCSELNIDNMIEIKGFYNYENIRSIMLNDIYSSFSYEYNTKMIQYYNTSIGSGLTFNVTVIIKYTKAN